MPNPPTCSSVAVRPALPGVHPDRSTAAGQSEPHRQHASRLRCTQELASGDRRCRASLRRRGIRSRIAPAGSSRRTGLAGIAGRSSGPGRGLVDGGGCGSAMSETPNASMPRCCWPARSSASTGSSSGPGSHVEAPGPLLGMEGPWLRWAPLRSGGLRIPPGLEGEGRRRVALATAGNQMLACGVCGLTSR
jgi:hypothetical protein